MKSQYTLDCDIRSDNVVKNYEALSFEDMGQFPPGAYFRLKQLVTADNSKTRRLIQLIMR